MAVHVEYWVDDSVTSADNLHTDRSKELDGDDYDPTVHEIIDTYDCDEDTYNSTILANTSILFKDIYQEGDIVRIHLVRTGLPFKGD